MAMVQFNLLPDVKLAYIKAERQKQIVLTVSIFVSIGAIILFVFLFSYANFVQKKSISDLTTDITKGSEDITSTKDLSKILTVQNQINKLSQLHDAKVLPTRLLDDIQKMTPGNITIGKLEADYTAGTVTVEGSGTSVKDINTFVDVFKFTKFTVKVNDEDVQDYAFSEVVLSELGLEKDEPPKFTITAKYKAELFAQTTDPVLNVPKQVTTRSVTERPGEIFNKGNN